MSNPDGASGPRRRSGRHVAPRRKLGEPGGSWSRQDMAAAQLGVAWSAWAGAVLEEAARMEVGAQLEPEAGKEKSA